MARKPRIVESLKAAAHALGVDPELVKRAKEMACPAFKPGNRIEIEELRKWIAEHSEELKTVALSLKDQKLNEEIRKLKIANDIKAKLSVLRENVKAANAECIERIRTFLEAKLENEYPSAVVGMEVPQARVYGRRVNDQILAELQKLKDVWAKI